MNLNLSLFHYPRGRRVLHKVRTQVEATRKRTERILWELVEIFDSIYTFISPTQDVDIMADINLFLNSVNQCLVEIFNHYAPTKLPKFKTDLSNSVNILHAKLIRNRSILDLSFHFLSFFEDVKLMQFMCNDLERAVKYSHDFLSAEMNLATPKYMKKSW